MKLGLNKWLVQLLLCGVLCTGQAMAQTQSEKITLNFVDAEVEEVVKAVAHITKRNFVVDPRVKGKINIVSAEPVAAPLAYDILLSALRLQGFTSVESEGVTKILPEADAKLHIATSRDRSSKSDKLVTRIYKLKYESAPQMVPILRPLVAPNNIVSAYPGSNTLVVTDYASNLKRVEQIVRAIDQPDREEPVVIPVEYASAMDIAQTINHLMQSSGAAKKGRTDGREFVLLADARSNSLLLRTENPAQLAQVQGLVKKLDVETSVPGNIHVVYLKNAEAVRIAETLRAVLSGETRSSTASSGQGTAQTARAAAKTPVPSSNNQSGGAASAGTTGGGIVQADPATNSLIITAPDAIYNNLRAVIEKLDVRRAQVFVEALVVEVKAEKAAEFGIQWQDLAAVNKSGTELAGGTNFGGAGTSIISAASNIASVGNGLNVGVVRGVTEIPGVGEVVNLAMLARALESEANANILSTPNLLTLDNEEAKIIIGQNVPFVTGSYAQTGNTATASPFQTIERQDVGLTLRIKPQVSQGGTVRLQIFQEVSSVEDQSINNQAGVITNKRSLESTVLADEGEIVVLGGLIQDSVSDGEDKVPVLGDIPLLGALFRYEKRQRTKTNLMVFIRPYVLRTASDSQGVTQDRYDYLRGQQAQVQIEPHAILPDLKSPQMPEYQAHQEQPQSQSPSSDRAPVSVQSNSASDSTAQPSQTGAEEQAAPAAVEQEAEVTPRDDASVDALDETVSESPADQDSGYQPYQSAFSN